MGVMKDAGKHRALDALVGTASGSAISHASLHTGHPATDANEIEGGTYARQAVTFGSAATGSVATTADVEFNVPASTTVAAVGYYTAATEGTLMADGNVTNETFADAGTYTLESGSSIDLDDPAS